jgi:hypothetical protein
VPPEWQLDAGHAYPAPLASDLRIPTSIRECRLIHILDMQEDSELLEVSRQRARIAGYHTWVAVPMIRDGRGIGTIAVARRERKAFSDRELALLRSFTDQAVIAIGRIAPHDVECGGTPIGQGQLVLAVLGAANRDPVHFPDPERFDAARHPNFHLAFGHGHHHCVGSELARLEARLAFTILLTELGTLELLPAVLRHRENFNMRCFQTLLVRLTA